MSKWESTNNKDGKGIVKEIKTEKVFQSSGINL